MPLTRLANAVIDAVADAPGPVADEVAKYLGSDLLCYRAEAPDGLVERQTQHWDPVLAWAREALGARFVLAQGVMHVAQPAEAIAAAARENSRRDDRGGWARCRRSPRSPAQACWRWRSPMARSTPDAAWAAAHVDEDWQMSQWGRDDAALERRAYRRAEFEAAVAVLRLADLSPHKRGEGF